MKWPVRLPNIISWRCAVRLYSKKSKKYSDTLYLPKTSFPVLRSEATIKREKEIQKLSAFVSLYKWQREALVGDEFVLHDGPPYANGEPHVGHALNKIVKDITNRYKVMRGHKIFFRPGWDCHGLPIELKATSDDHALTTLEIRGAARKFAEKSIDVQKSHFQNWAVMGDWENPYYTFDKSYQVEQLKAFYTMYEKGLVYQDYLPVYWSPSSRTALAEAELVYNDNHVSTAVYVSFEISQLPDSIQRKLRTTDTVHAIIWTTTPWTLPANEAVCYGPNLNYIFARCSKTGNIYLMASDLMAAVGKEIDTSWQLLLTVDGSELSGTKYLHPLRNQFEGQFLPGHHVMSDQGTGLVHTAPAHGFDDFHIALGGRLPVDCWVDESGCYNGDVLPSSLRGVSVLDKGSSQVIDLLAENVLHSENYRHSYPYDWRTNKPVLIRASKQWFINTDRIKQQAEQCLANVPVNPPSFKSSLITQLNARPYWCISRQRVWGVPIPVFYNKATGEPLICPTSLDHIVGLIAQQGADIWWTLPMDQLLPQSVIEQCGADLNAEYVKGEDILDIWFDSGTSWASVLKERNFQADLYLEGVDQLGGWFQSSLLTCAAVNGTSPYRSLLLHGFTVDEKKKKMSKSKGNVVRPSDVIIGKKGAPGVGVDVLRWWAASATKATAANSEIGPTVLQKMSSQLYKVKKVCRYLLGNLNDFKADEDMVVYSDLLPQDKYMLHLLREFQERVTLAFDEYRYSRVLQLVENFLNNSVSNFYCNIIKDRLYCDEKEGLYRRSSQTIIYQIIDTIARALGPITPHMAEEIMIHHPSYGAQGQSLEDCSVFRTGWFKSHQDWNNDSVKSLIEAVLDIRKEIYNLSKASDPSLYDISILCETELFWQLDCLQTDSPMTSPLTEIFQSAQTHVLRKGENVLSHGGLVGEGVVALLSKQHLYTFTVTDAVLFKCERCRRHIAEQSNSPCDRCMEVLGVQWAS